MLHRTISLLCIGLSLLTITPCTLAAKGEKKKKKDEHLVTSLANEYMRAFAVEEDEDEEGEEDVDKKPASDAQKPQDDKKNKIEVKIGDRVIEIPLLGQLSELDRYKVAFHMLDVHVNQGKLPVHKTVDKTFVRSMELVYGGTEGKNNLIHDINYSTGVIAETALAWTYAQPSPDIGQLQHNQALIKELARDTEFFAMLHSKLQKLAALEEVLLAFYTPQDAAFFEAVSKLGFYSAGHSLKAVSLRTGGMLAMQGLMLFGAGITGTVLPICAYQGYKGQLGTQQENRLGMIVSSFFTIMAPGFLYVASEQIKGLAQTVCLVQQRMIDFASYMDTFREIYNLVNTHPTFKNHFAHLRHLNRLFENRVSDNATRLLKELQCNTFKGKPSYWFSYNGRTLATYALLQETKNELCDAIMAGGQLGALVSATRLYLDHQDTPARYSFVEFVNGDRPYIGATNLWNPRLDAHKAVPSSFEMGGSSAFNMVLTGGNGLGKSTIMKGLLYAMLIAQTFGIAPADRLVMTPFSRMICHTNVTDNVAAGLSGFTAELAMKDAILKEYTLLKPNEFAITVFDELFKSTNPDDAAQLSKQLCRSLAQYKNGMSIIATHLAPVTELETEGTHANYHPGSISQGDGKPAKPTYTLEKGASFDHNAVALYNAGNK